MKQNTVSLVRGAMGEDRDQHLRDQRLCAVARAEVIGLDLGMRVKGWVFRNSIRGRLS